MTTDGLIESSIASISQGNKTLSELMNKPCYSESMRLTAVSLKHKYDSYINAGFTEEQAFELTLKAAGQYDNTTSTRTVS